MDPETKRLLFIAAALAINLNVLVLTRRWGATVSGGPLAWLRRASFLPPSTAVVAVALIAPLLTFLLTSLQLGVPAWSLGSLPGVLIGDTLISLTVAAWIGLPLLLWRWRTARDCGQRRCLRHAVLALLPLTLVGLFCLPQRPRQRTAALLRAIERRDLDAARIALDNGADPNLPAPLSDSYRDAQRWPLDAAAETGNHAMVTLLVARGADTNQTHWLTALNAGDEPMASLLIAASDRRYWLSEMNDALIMAAHRDEPHKVRFLLHHGADPNVPVDHHPTRTLLQALVAAGQGNSRAAAFLREAGAHE